MGAPWQLRGRAVLHQSPHLVTALGRVLTGEVARTRVAGGEGQKIWRQCRSFLPRLSPIRGLLQNHMRVGAAEAE